MFLIYISDLLLKNAFVGSTINYAWCCPKYCKDMEDNKLYKIQRKLKREKDGVRGPT